MTQRQLEREITKIYQQARDDIGRKWYDYFEKGSERLAEKEGDLRAARAAGNKAEADRLEKELIRDKRNFTEGNKYYKDMIKETTRQMANANQTAAAYVNNQLPSFYQQSFNEEMSAEAVQMGVRYDLADEATVARRIKDGDIELPARKVDIPKDQRWNTKQINANVTQGIIQGESMDRIAKRLEPIMDGNRKAAIRNARTLVNGAENQGRQDRYEDLKKQGAIMKKVWIATGDERTRDWHLEMDGQEVDIDEDFVDGNGNELEYPGDPKAAPETVYNCRCTMKSKIVGFKKADGTIINLKDYGGSELHKEEIRQEIERREAEQQKEETTESAFTGIVEGKDITGEWKRRPDLFEHEINDIINAQGYDGAPRIVSAEEFDKLVKEANGGEGFIAQRSYSAPDEETLQAYQDMLYGKNGREWYIDCATGGSQYGQGMYCAADYNGELTKGIRTEMSHYRQIGEERVGATAASNEEKLDYITSWAKENYPDNWQNVRDYIGLETGTVDWDIGSKAAMELGAEGRRELLDTGIKEEVYYLRTGAYSNTETITLDSSAKIVEYKKILDEYIDATEFNGENWNDVGSYAAAKGYDAINAKGHGKSGSYTVILNRTKVIIKEGA